MPDELLSDPRENKLATKRGAFNQAAEDEGESEELEKELTFEVQNTQNFAPSTGIFEEGFVEDEESSLHEGLAESISAVERVYQDMDLRARTAAVQPEVEEVVVIAEAPAAPEVHEIHEIREEAREEEREQEDLVSYASASPFETEIDPVTGIYRLKAKPNADEGSNDHSGNHGEDDSVEGAAQGQELHQAREQWQAPASDYAQETTWNAEQKAAVAG